MMISGMAGGVFRVSCLASNDRAIHSVDFVLFLLETMDDT
jgi:hypothetical protein